MKRCTLAEPFDGQYRLHLQFSGKPFWCRFDYAVQLDAGVAGLEIALAASADDVSVEWFPHLRRGMLRGAEWDHERGVEWAGVRVEIRKIYTHPIDTTARGCEFHGVSFIGDLRKRSVMLPDQEQAGQAANE